MIQGIVKIKNVSGVDYVVSELGGHVLSDQGELNLLDTTLPKFYDDWYVANRIVTEANPSQIYQDIQSGLLELIECLPPVDKGPTQ